MSSAVFPENSEGVRPAINLCPQTQMLLDHAAGQQSETHQQVHLRITGEKKKVKVLERLRQSLDLNPINMLFCDML